MSYWCKVFPSCHCYFSLFHASIMCSKFEWINRSIISGFVKSTLSLLFIISMFSVDFQSREPLISPSFVWPLPTTSLFRIKEPFIALYPDHITSPKNLPRSSKGYLSCPENIWLFFTLILALSAWFFTPQPNGQTDFPLSISLGDFSHQIKQTKTKLHNHN